MKTRGAFTLIELLVVIAVIAVLMGILMPVLSMARLQGRKSVCGAHQHSLALAYAAYATANDDRFILTESPQPFFLTTRSGFGGWQENRHRWEPYTTPDIFYCPAMGDGFQGVKGPKDSSGETGKTGFVGWSVNPIGEAGDYYVVSAYLFMAGWNGSDTGLNNHRMKYLSSDSRENLQARRANAKEMPLRFSETRSPSTVPLVADVTRTRDTADLDAMLGWQWLPYRIDNFEEGNNYSLNHYSGERVLGINSAYADGHVEWHSERVILPRAWSNPFYINWY